MKVNLNIPVREYDGAAVKNENDVEVTIGDLVGKVLFASKGMEQADMMRAYDITEKIQKDAASVELTSEDITFIKEQTVKVFNVGIYGQLYNILEQR